MKAAILIMKVGFAESPTTTDFLQNQLFFSAIGAKKIGFIASILFKERLRQCDRAHPQISEW
jgi:hypothetical protein